MPAPTEASATTQDEQWRENRCREQGRGRGPSTQVGCARLSHEWDGRASSRHSGVVGRSGGRVSGTRRENGTNEGPERGAEASASAAGRRGSRPSPETRALASHRPATPAGVEGGRPAPRAAGRDAGTPGARLTVLKFLLLSLRAFVHFTNALVTARTASR